MYGIYLYNIISDIKHYSFGNLIISRYQYGLYVFTYALVSYNYM